MEYKQNDPGEGETQVTRLDYPGGATGVSSSLRCHPGAVREENQDCVGRAESAIGELYLVLDGVGGRTGGARASSLALAEYQRFISDVAADADPAEVLGEATAWVNGQLEEAKRSGPPEMQEMASTVALVLINGKTAYVGHIGDSRVYRMRNGEFTALTQDHSVVQRLMSEGIITEEQAKSHPSSHILTRSLGQADAALEVSSHAVAPGDVMLICSDGLWGYAAAEEIERVVATPGASSAAIADSLLELALAGEAGDNISVVVMRMADRWQPGKVVVRTKIRFGRKGWFTVLGVVAVLASVAAYVYYTTP